MNASLTASRDLMRKFIRRAALSVLFVGVILFGAAGTLNWPQAWVYLALTAAMSFAGGFWLARHDADLLNERLGSLIQREQKGWDKLLMVAMLALWTGWLILIGLDAGRYRWSQAPLAFQGAGFVLLCLASYLVWLTLKANTATRRRSSRSRRSVGIWWRRPGLTPTCVTPCMPALSCLSWARRS